MSDAFFEKFFGDSEPGHLGTGWMSGTSSVFFGLLGIGGALCLHAPGLLTLPDARAHYPMTIIHPEAIFTAIETTGDGEVNVQSRIQMDLFKARKRAEAEYRSAVARTGLTEAALKSKLHSKRRGLHYPPHIVAGTAANQVLELARIGELSRED